MSALASLPLHSHALLSSFYQNPILLFSSRKFTRTAVEVRPRKVRCVGADIDTARRSGNYQRSCDFLESLSRHDFTIEKCGEEREKMIAEVKDIINNRGLDPLRRVELADAIERLGISRHFQDDIRRSVENVYEDGSCYSSDDLYSAALMFRMLRQHGYAISEDIFNKFMNDTGRLSDVLREDVKALLSLYEASFMEWEEDERLVEIRVISVQYLKEQLGKLTAIRAKEVQQALDLPLHWRFPRLKARWSIDAYEQFQTRPLPLVLMRLAKLDYNLMQSGYREEIKRLTRWWTLLNLPSKLPYSRDRLMEHYLWCVGLVEEADHTHFREMETKLICLVSAMDDTYDNYGTVQELEILTNLIDRWDVSGIDKLQKPMRHCFLAVYNTSNDIADWVLKEKGFNIIPHLSKAWARLCNHYFQEAKWCAQAHKPHFEEYLYHGRISVATHIALLACYFLTSPIISRDALDYIDDLPTLLLSAGTIVRLSNDLGTSQAELVRGDNIKAVECYMNETGASERAARKHVNGLIHKAWRDMNKEYYLLPHQHPTAISEPYLGANVNLARTSVFLYNFQKDWHGKLGKEVMEHIRLLLIDPVNLSIVN